MSKRLTHRPSKLGRCQDKRGRKTNAPQLSNDDKNFLLKWGKYVRVDGLIHETLTVKALESEFERV